VSGSRLQVPSAKLPWLAISDLRCNFIVKSWLRAVLRSLIAPFPQNRPYSGRKGIIRLSKAKVNNAEVIGFRCQVSGVGCQVPGVRG
jgi:hypothetical protein